MSGMFILDPEPGFFPIPDPEGPEPRSRGKKRMDPGSQSQIESATLQLHILSARGDTTWSTFQTK
jgi:hypothetical protein